jgi:hypothetical protein
MYILVLSSSLESQEYGRGDVTLTTWHPLSAKVDNNYADKQLLFGQYSSLADSGHGVFLYRIHAKKKKNPKIEGDSSPTSHETSSHSVKIKFPN